LARLLELQSDLRQNLAEYPVDQRRDRMPLSVVPLAELSLKSE
jgi:hypothetical protein